MRDFFRPGFAPFEEKRYEQSGPQKTEDYTRTHFQDLGARIGGAPIATGSSGRRRGSLLGGYPEPGEVRKRLRAFIYTRRVLVSAPWETGDGHSVHF